MPTLNFDFPLRLPSLSEKYSCSNRFIVGYFRGSSFIKFGFYDNLESACHRQADLLAKGCDARVFEIRNEVFLVV